MEYKFSIVMPIYNVEKYLNQSIDCLLKQTYTNFELILVNDCSPDSSRDICLHYKNCNDNIIFVDLEKNGGLSNARNQGMKFASGDYILFLDSDDYVDESLLESINTSLNSNEADAVIFGLYEEYYLHGDVDYRKIIAFENKEIHLASDVRKMALPLEKSTLFGYAWNKAYKLSLLKDNNLLFENITMIEDVVFNLKFFNLMNSLNILEGSYYHYAIRNNGSLTSKYLPNYFELHSMRVEKFYNSLKEWELLTHENLEGLAAIYCRYLISAIQRLYHTNANMTYKKRCIWLKEIYNDTFFNILKPYMNSDNKFLSVFMSLFKSKSITITIVLCFFVFFIKEKCPSLFSRLKQNR